MEDAKKELDKIMSEMTELAKTVVKEFEQNPADISGSMVYIHEDSPYVDENYPDKGWNRVIKNIQKK